MTGAARTANVGMQPDHAPPEFAALMEDIQHNSVSLIADGADYPAYVEMLQGMHRRLPADMRDTLMDWPSMLGIGRMLWRQIPHPRLDYALAVLPDPERNAPCHCSSGRKYKHCCLTHAQTMSTLPQMNFLPMLLGFLPMRRWSELAHSRVPADMVLDAAIQMNEDQYEKDTCTLLEPWFADDGDFRARREDLFDALLDAYTALPRPRKKAKLLDRAIAVGDRHMRSAALQRKTTMLADGGDFAGAWKMFAEAQRADPQSVSLSHLEVTLLLSEGRDGEARERARFWAHRMAAMRDPELADLIDFMRDIAEHGGQAMHRFLLDHEPELRELSELLPAAPSVASQYTLDGSDDNAGPLKPKRGLKNALREWSAVAPMHAHSLVFDDAGADSGGIESWLPVLRAHPALWNAFEVLDSIAVALRDRDITPLTEGLVRPLLDRGESLLREVLHANHAEGKLLEWGWLENRPALSLLGARIAIDWDKPVDDAQMVRLEWLVRTLNPNDNQGFRDMLMRGYLQTGRIDDALALGADYPDDSGAMDYNRALALFAAGESGAALTALRDAVDVSPKLLDWLLKANPKVPAQGQWGVQVGSNEEAWIYRCETLALWQQYDAMEWLRSCAKALKQRR